MLKEQIASKMKEYMREKNKLKLSGIRMANAAIKNKEIEVRRELTDDEVVSILKKQIKEHIESLKYLEKGTQARNEYLTYIKALEKFVPEEMPEDVAREIIIKLLSDSNISYKNQIGIAMKTVIPELKGKIDNSVINKIIKEILI